MPPLAPTDHIFTKVHSKLTRAELVELAAALGLEVEERANTQQLKAITRQKLRNNLSRYIRHPSFEQLFSKRDHQNYEREQMMEEDHDEWEGFQEAGPEDSALHQPSSNRPHRQNRERTSTHVGPIRNRSQRRFRVAKRSMKELIAQDLEQRAKEKAPNNEPGSSGKFLFVMLSLSKAPLWTTSPCVGTCIPFITGSRPVGARYERRSKPTYIRIQAALEVE
jgi:hypothetical protein